MLMEGTGLYIGLLILIIFIVYATSKICLGSLLKRAKLPAWKGYVPIYSTYVLVDLLEMKKSIFFLTLIPILNLYFYNLIMAKFLEGFSLDSKDSIWYLIIPMYKFPELVFRKPKFTLNAYDLTEEFVSNQKALFDKPIEEKEPVNIDNNQNANNFENNLVDTEPNIYETTITEEEKHQTTYVEAPKEEEKKEEKPIIQPLDDGRLKLCPKCNTKLTAGAETCFMCGYHFD